jgi:hypothetical protein
MYEVEIRMVAFFLSLFYYLALLTSEGKAIISEAKPIISEGKAIIS